MKKRNETMVIKLKSSAAALALSVALLGASTAPVLNYSERRVANETQYSSGELNTYSEADTGEMQDYIVGYANKSSHPGVTISGDKIQYALPGIPSRNLYSYKTLGLTVNGKSLSQPAAVINNITYIPLRAYFETLGAKISYNSASRTMTVSHNGLYLTATDGGYVIYANDRPIFNFSPNIIMSNGRMYCSLSSLMKITGGTASSTASSVSISGAYNPLVSAAKFYREDEVFWLARIITAEAKGESLIGQIAVGNVIMNRVASPLYPNTIYGVIFDRKYGVQFSPILDGSIYNTPSYTATLAAKIILEGTRLSDNAMFFLNPKTAESSWIVNNRKYLYTIGSHDFYL